MNQPMTCARCGGELRSGHETCPRCLLKLAIEPAARADEPVEAASSSAPRARPVAPPLAEIAAAFPEYEVIELVGVGGMGAVYKARQRKLERFVALKVLPREISSDRALAERFLREARALARLSHPSIVAIHELGESGGFPYLALEFVDGVNLRALLRERQLAPREALAIVKELCDALQFAHDEGIVHRDIKPENVLVDRRGRVKVADFGLAKLVGRVDDDFRTRDDVAVGTPHYMAPEQLEHPRDVDHRADLYALGVVLYEMLTGSLPRGNFELPSRRVQVDVRLDDVVLKALEREPSRRYQHAIDVRTDVEAAEVPSPSAAASPSAPARPAPSDELDETLRDLGDDAGADAIDDPEARVIGVRVVAGSRVMSWRFVGSGIVLTLAMWLAYWIVVAFAWNVGPKALAAALVLGGVLVVASVRDVAGGERGRWTSPFVVAGGALAVVGVASVVVGHVAAWERGVLARYEPPPFSTVPALLELASSLPRAAGALTPAVRAHGYDVEVPNELFRVDFGVWLGVGFAACLLGAAFVAAARRNQLGHAIPAGLPTTFSSALALAILWACVWLPNMEWRRTLDPSRPRVVDVAIEPATLAETLRARLVESELLVHGEGTGEIVARSKPPTTRAATLFLAGPSSPLERWRITWRGVVCRAPRYSIAVLGGESDPASQLVIDAGRFAPDEESTVARFAAERFAEELTRDLKAR